MLDRITFETESASSSHYDDLIRVEYQLFRDLIFKNEVFVQGERDTYGDMNFSAGLRFELD